jgi:hypothetical protein
VLVLVLVFVYCTATGEEGHAAPLARAQQQLLSWVCCTGAHASSLLQRGRTPLHSHIVTAAEGAHPTALTHCDCCRGDAPRYTHTL